MAVGLQDNNKIREVNDKPNLRAANYAKADDILTEDKDNKEAGLMKPRIMTATVFIKKMQGIT